MLVAVSLTSCSSGSSDDGGDASTYSGSYTVNGASYNSLMLVGTADSGAATLSGSGGTLSGTYAHSTGASVRATISFSGGYTLTFDNKTIIMTFNGNTCTLSSGSWTASGTGTLVVPVSGNSACHHQSTQEELSFFSSLVGTTKWAIPLAQRSTERNYTCLELAINADGSGTITSYYEDKNGTRVTSSTPNLHYPSSFIHSYIETDERSWSFWTCDNSVPGHMSTNIELGFRDTNGDGVLDTADTSDSIDYTLKRQ